MRGPDEWLTQVKQGQYLQESEMKQLCDIVKEYLVEESNIQPVSSPVTICGDIHGQFYDLLELFKVGGEIPNTSYIFMVFQSIYSKGDFVDRGYYSLETFTLLLVLKARFLLLNPDIPTKLPFCAEIMNLGRLPKCTVFMVSFKVMIQTAFN